MKKIFVISLAAVALFASCAKQMEIVAPTGVNLDQTALTMTPGQVVDLKATITPSNVTSTALTWTSSNTAVATVTKDWGQVAAIAPDHKTMGPGKATITATTSDGKQAVKCEVTVNPIKVTGITLDATAEVYEFEEVKLTPKVTPANASFKDSLIWESSDVTKATVKDGVVTGVKEGKATITVTTKDGGFKSTCNVTVKLSKNLNIWVSDAKGEAKLDGGEYEKKADWITYKNGVVSWEENKTGKPRTGTIVIAESHASATITQFEAGDFYGNWEFNTKFFTNNTAVIPAAKDPGQLALTFGKPLLGETLEDHDGTSYTNNVGVIGMYLDAVCDATVTINYEKKDVKFGLFMDCRDNAQLVKNGVEGYNYVAFTPELGANPTTFGSPWNFVNPTIDSVKDYQWIWFTVSDDFNELVCDTAVQQQKCIGDAVPDTTPYIIGVSCLVSSSKKVNPTTVKNQYNVIYQFNPKGASGKTETNTNKMVRK